MKKTVLITLMSLSSVSFAEVIAIGHPTTSATLSDVIKTWEGKGGYKPIENTPIKDGFCEVVLGSSCSVVDKKLSRMIFSGRATPPEKTASDAETISKVASDPKAIGFINSSSLTGEVKKISN